MPLLSYPTCSQPAFVSSLHSKYIWDPPASHHLSCSSHHPRWCAVSSLLTGALLSPFSSPQSLRFTQQPERFIESMSVRGQWGRGHLSLRRDFQRLLKEIFWVNVEGGFSRPKDLLAHLSGPSHLWTLGLPSSRSLEEVLSIIWSRCRWLTHGRGHSDTGVS